MRLIISGDMAENLRVETVLVQEIEGDGEGLLRHADHEGAEGAACDLVDRAGEDVRLDVEIARKPRQDRVGGMRTAKADADDRLAAGRRLGREPVLRRKAAGRGRIRRRGRSASPRAADG